MLCPQAVWAVVSNLAYSSKAFELSHAASSHTHNSIPIIYLYVFIVLCILDNPANNPDYSV